MTTRHNPQTDLQELQDAINFFHTASPATLLKIIMFAMLLLIVIQGLTLLFARGVARQRFVRSWDIIKQCSAILLQDWQLLFFPVLSSLLSLTLSLVYAWPLINGLKQHDQAAMEQAIASEQLVGFGNIVHIFIYVFLLYFLIIFFNTAMVGTLRIRLSGGTAGIADGFSAAFSRLPQILGYALLASTVGMLLRWVSEHSEHWLARAIIGMIGIAWNLAVFLVVPVLVYEGVGPLAAVTRSMDLLKRTWGEQVIGKVAIQSVVNTLVLLVAFAPLLLLSMLAVAIHKPLLLYLFFLALVLVFASMALIGSAMTSVYSTLLYGYATGRDNYQQAGFTQESMQNAFAPRE
jgi:Family of unknown function (DUF6159)